MEDFLYNDIIAFGDYREGDLRKFKDIEELEGKLTQLKQTKHSFPTAKYHLRFRDDANIGDIVFLERIDFLPYLISLSLVTCDALLIVKSIPSSDNLDLMPVTSIQVSDSTSLIISIS